MSTAINAHKTVHVVIREDERSSSHDWDWSSKHTRLKYQMVTTCIIFFSMCVFKFTETSVPILGWKIDGDVNSLVICGTFLFSLIAVYSFYSRSKIERKELSPSGNYAYQEFKSVNTEIAKLKNTLETVSRPNFESLQQVQSVLKENSKFIRENCPTLLKQAEVLSRLPLLIDQRLSLIKKSNQLYSDEAIEVFMSGKTQEQIDQLGQSLFHENMQEPANEKLAEIPSVKKEIEELNKSEKFLEVISLHTTKEGQFLNHVGNSRKMIYSHEEKMSSFLSELEATIERVVSLNDSVSDFIRNGEVAHREITFDRKWLSFKIPLFFSIAILIAGIPFGIGKISNAVLQQKYCWCIL